MLEIKVSYKIWDDIIAKYSDDHYYIIWYEYIESRGIRYICSNGTDKWRQYFYEYEIDSNNKNKWNVWFICKK